MQRRIVKLFSSKTGTTPCSITHSPRSPNSSSSLMTQDISALPRVARPMYHAPPSTCGVPESRSRELQGWRRKRCLQGRELVFVFALVLAGEPAFEHAPRQVLSSQAKGDGQSQHQGSEQDGEGGNDGLLRQPQLLEGHS